MATTDLRAESACVTPTNRRAFIAAHGMIAAVPAVAAGATVAPLAPAHDPVSAYWAAYKAINTGRMSEEDYCLAVDNLDFSEPQTERDFIRKFLAMFVDLSAPSDERLELLIEQGRRMVGEA